MSSSKNDASVITKICFSIRNLPLRGLGSTPEVHSSTSMTVRRDRSTTGSMIARVELTYYSESNSLVL